MLGFEYTRPGSLDECLGLLSEVPSPRLLNGGTDLIADMARHPETWQQVRMIIDVKGVPEQWRIEPWGDVLRVGGSVTHAQLIQSTLVQSWAPLLVDASRVIGDHQIRNRGTLAGNAVTASPAGDAILCLLALDGRIELTSVRGSRELPVAEFIIAPNTTALACDELVSAVLIPRSSGRSGECYVKVGRRKALTVAIVNVAAQLTLRDGLIDKAAIALGSVAPTPVRATEAENALLGEKPSVQLFKEASQLALRACKPIVDVRASAKERLTLLTGVLFSALSSATELAQQRQA